MSKNDGPLSGCNIVVCGTFKPRTQDDIVKDIERLGGTGFKNKLPDDALCVICTPEAAETNKTAQDATTKGIPAVGLQWLDDGGYPANLDQYLISRSEDKAEDRRESLSHSTPPQQTADASKPEIPETRSRMDRYEGNAESAESTPTKPSTWKERLNSTLKFVAGTPQKKSSAAPTVEEDKVSFKNPTFDGKETSENANGFDTIDADTDPKAISAGGLEDPSSPTETPSSARRSAAGQSGESQFVGSTEGPIHASSQRPDDSRKGSNPNDSITASSASPETQIDGWREGSTESNPILVTSASPETQIDGWREGSTESNPITASSVSPETHTDGRREGSTERNPIHVASESPEPPKTSQATPILKQESRGGNGQQPESGRDDQDHGRQEHHEPQKRMDQGKADQGNRSDSAGESDKENQEPSPQEPDLYGSTPVIQAKQPATQGESHLQKQKEQTDEALQGQSKTSREKQPGSGRIIQSTESAEEVPYNKEYFKLKTPAGNHPPKPTLIHSNDQGPSVKGLRSPESATTVVRDDGFDPHKWAETHAVGDDQMERHPRFSDWKDFPHPKTGLWIEIDDFEEPDKKIWVLARGITYKNQLAVESIGFKEGQSRGLSLSAAAYKNEIAALRRKGIGQFLPGEARDFTGIKERRRWNDAQNAFNVVFFAEAHGEKNNGDCLVVYDEGRALSKTDIIKAGGTKWGRIIESHRRPEISVAPGKAPWPEESVTRAAPMAIPLATQLASSPPAAMLPTPKSVGQPRFVHAPQAVPRPAGGIPLQRSSTERTQRAVFPPVSSLSSVPAAPQPSATPTAPMGFPPTVVPPVNPPTRPPTTNMAQGFQQPMYRPFPGPQNWMQPPMGWPAQEFVSYQQQAAPFYVLPASQSPYSTRDVSMDPSGSFRGSSQPPLAMQTAMEPPNLKSRGRVLLQQNMNGAWHLGTFKVSFPDGRIPSLAGQVDWETDGLNEYARTRDGRLWRVALEVNP